MTVLNLIATLLTSVAMRFSTVIATLLVFTIFFTSIEFQKSNSNAVAEHKIVCIWIARALVTLTKYMYKVKVRSTSTKYKYEVQAISKALLLHGLV